jgi:Tol biopolymer transport system component
MSDLRSIVDRELERVELRPFTLETFHRRRERKRRNQRIAAGAVGIAIAIALIAVVIATSIVRSSPVPANPPSPTAMHAGALTFVDASGMIALIDPGAGHPRQLVSGDALAFDWSPDGTELAYMLETQTPPGSSSCSLWTLDMGSRQSKRLTSCGGKPFAYGELIDWAPDGAQIAFVSDGTIHMVARDGTGERILTTGISPTWYPDGKRISFTGATGALEELDVAAGDGASPIVVAPEGTLAPDGATIAILRDVPGRPDPACRMCDHRVLQVWLIRPDGSAETKVARQFGCCFGNPSTMCWSTDGSRISLTGSHFQVIEVATGTSRIADRPGMDLSVCPSWRPVPSAGG